MDYLLSNANEDKLLLNSGVYPQEEMRSLITMRKQLDAKIRQKDKSSLMKYIRCEKKIFSKLSSLHRRETELCKQCILRIMKAHSVGLSWFKDDLNIWMSYIRFCTGIGDVKKVTETLPLMLQSHTNANLWLIAAQWELAQFENHDKALSYLYRGIHHNPTARDLYVEIMKLELSGNENANENKEKQIEVENKVLNLLEITKKHIKDLDLYLKFLHICIKYKFTNNLQVQLCLYIMKNFRNNENAWNFLAQRELFGHHVTNVTIDILNDDYVINNNYDTVENREDQIKNCLNIYKISLEVIDTEKMWEKYLNTLVDLHEKQDDQIFIQETFMSACKIAHEKGYMTEIHYSIWLRAIKDSPNLPTILKQATTRKPQYIKLWVERILCHAIKNQESIVESVFDEAVSTLGDNSIQIWRRKIQYYQLKSDNCNTIESVYRAALEFSPTISILIQPQYLEWLSLFRNKDVVHEIYKELSQKKPFCIELHKKMVELEAISVEQNDEIFQYIKNTVDNNPEHLNEWKEYIFKEVNYGPTWRKPIFEKYFSDAM